MLNFSDYMPNFVDVVFLLRVFVHCWLHCTLCRLSSTLKHQHNLLNIGCMQEFFGLWIVEKMYIWIYCMLYPLDNLDFWCVKIAAFVIFDYVLTPGLVSSAMLDPYRYDNHNHEMLVPSWQEILQFPPFPCQWPCWSQPSSLLCWLYRLSAYVLRNGTSP